MAARCDDCMVVVSGDFQATVFLCDDHKGRSVIVPTILNVEESP